MGNAPEYNVISALIVNRVFPQIDDLKDYSRSFSKTTFIIDILWMNWLLNITIQDNGSKREYTPTSLS